jgi:hypothetical protein
MSHIGFPVRGERIMSSTKARQTAAHRKLDRRRVYLCAGESRMNASSNFPLIFRVNIGEE